jgi:hypothetical protein
MGNEAELASQIRRLITNTELGHQLGAEGRKMMQTEFEITKQSEKYIRLYNSMLNQNRFKRSIRQAA